MNPPTSRKIFVNLAVRDLKRAMTFFSKLGFEFNPQLTDDKAACMIISGDAYVMLLGEGFFQTFTEKAICDTRTHTEGLFALSCDRRAEVDAFYAAAMAHGGRDNGGPGLRPEYSPDYYAAFVYDPDGNNIEAVCHAP